MSNARTIADLAAVTSTAEELNHVDGVTSAIQTQLDAKATTASPIFTGNVGIGTGATVNGQLHVKESASSNTASTSAQNLVLESNDTNFGMTLLAGSSANSANIFFGNESDSDIGYIQYKHTDDSVRFGVNAAERMRINSSGNVIIGATSAGNAKVTSVDGVAFEARDSTQPFYQWYNSGAGANLKYWRCGPNTSGDLQWQTVNDAYSSATVRMVIDDTGKVGIGTSGPSFPLDIRAPDAGGDATLRVHCQHTGAGDDAILRLSIAGTTADSIIQFGDNDDADVGRIAYHHNGNSLRFFTGASERMRVTSSGDLLIGRTSTGNSATDYGVQLYNSGQLYIYSSSGGTADVIRGFDSTGTNNFAIDANGDYQDLSDAKYKENIASSERGLSDIMALNVVSFDWNNKDWHETSGFIAQEVEQSIPELVARNEDTGDLSIKTNNLIPMLTKALQEAVSRIETLESEVTALKGA
jgi:hypothetical protein